MESVEKAIADVVDKLPQIPENGRKTLVEWAPWLALAGGLINLWGAWALWDLGHRADKLINWANDLSRAYGGTTVESNLGLGFWLSLAAVAVVAVLMLAAFSGLKERSKSKGWNLVFYAEIVSLVAAVFSVVFDYRYGGGLFGALIGAAIGFYLLFQVRDHFKDGKAPAVRAEDKK